MSHPRFNHLALSVPSSLLDDEGRADIIRFHAEVFGWEEMPTMTKPGERLVLQAYSWDQFVFLIAEDDPMRCQRREHFGMSVDSKGQLDTFLERAEGFALTDDRVDIVGYEAEEFGDYLTLHSFYVRFLLPMMIEVQHYDWAPGIAPGPDA